MNEKERILNLLQAGRITPDEATMLLEALREVSQPGPAQWGFRPTPPVPPVPPVPPYPPHPGSPVVVIRPESGRNYLGPSGLRWVKVRLINGDLTATLDPELQEPQVDGEAELTQDEQNLVVGHGRRRRNRGQTKVLGMNINWDLDFSTDNDLDLRLPEGWGLEAVVASGHLQAHGLAYVRGEVMSGDAELRGVRGVDLRVASGDLDADLVLREGEHRLEVLSGDAEVRFLDSSVTVEGKLLSGDLDPRGNFSQQKRKILGTVGEGQALLKLNVMSGDLTLEDAHDRGEENHD